MAQKAGPKSSLKTGEADVTDTGKAGGRQAYSVQIHTDEKGLEVFEPIHADSGDDAAAQALKKKNYVGASVRGVTPYSDPDPNSLGGERDASVMIRNAESVSDSTRDLMGTKANRETAEKLGKADIKELGE